MSALGTRLIWAGAISLGLALARPGMAVDGVIEINQASANQGAINGSVDEDPPGFPVRISQSGSYRLTGSLEIGPDVSAIEIEAPGVKIDLNGFGIIGPAACSGTPVTSCSPSSGPPAINAGNDAWGASVRNGFVRGVAGTGVLLERESRLERVTLEANAGVGASLSWDGEVIECIAHRNGGTGISATTGTLRKVVSVGNGGGGILVNGSSQSLIVDSVAAGNANEGIFALSTRVEGVVAAANGEEGVEGGDPLIIESVLRGNTKEGTTLGSYGRSVIAGNGGSAGQTGTAKVIACSLVAGALTCPP